MYMAIVLYAPSLALSAGISHQYVFFRSQNILLNMFTPQKKFRSLKLEAFLILTFLHYSNMPVVTMKRSSSYFRNSKAYAFEYLNKY